MSGKSISVDKTLRRAQKHLKKREYAAARQLFQAVLDKFPGNSTAIAGMSSLPRMVQLSPRDNQGQQQIDSIVELFSRGYVSEALEQALSLVQQFPDMPGPMVLLASIYEGMEQNQSAIQYFKNALELNPADDSTLRRLGNLYFKLGMYEAAIDEYKSALKINPNNYSNYNNLGVAYSNLGNDLEAVASYKRAIEINPNSAQVYNNLGATLNNMARDEESIAYYRQALALMPDYVDAHCNLGNVLLGLGDVDGSIIHFQEAVKLDKDHLFARSSLYYQLGAVCDWGQLSGISDSLKMFEFGSVVSKIVQPFTMLALIDDGLFHLRVSESYSAVKYRASDKLGPLPDRQDVKRIRIAYFSADFHNHATMYLMAELFELHDRDRFEVHAFSYGLDVKDQMRERLLDSVEYFHDVRLMDNIQVAELSRSLGIDIAIDLKGHTTYGRVGIFSNRAAPIQVNYLGYPGTMGAPYYDYILADSVVIPPEFYRFYSEKVVALPNSYQVNDSTRKISDKFISRADCKLPENAFVFCCFNDNRKITPEVFDVWMRLLRNVDNSVLWLFKSNNLAEDNLRKEALSRSVDPGRLIFAERMPHAEHLARHRCADLFLDTFNFNAHTTASDALWAGLPIITRLGESFASRVCASLLNAVGLSDLIAQSVEEYERLALGLAMRPDDCAALRGRLQANVKLTALYDAVTFARDIETSYEKMLELYKKGLPPESFNIT